MNDDNNVRVFENHDIFKRRVSHTGTFVSGCLLEIGNNREEFLRVLNNGTFTDKICWAHIGKSFIQKI